MKLEMNADNKSRLHLMLSSRGEKVPLLGSRNGRAGQNETDTPFRRRTAPQHISMEEEDMSSYRFSPTKHEKSDRRGVGRMVHSVGLRFRTMMLRLIPEWHSVSAYEDGTNEEPWRWTFGTREDDGIWLNVNDRVGSVMACLVWLLILYSGFTILLLAQHHHLPIGVTGLHLTICTLALACHAKTTFTDPGSVPNGAIPPRVNNNVRFHSMCSVCETYKPKNAHHCRICKRCVCGMDHHCPWMNNCIGTGNMKHFVLFLAYTWTGSALALILFAVNYFFCDNEYCEFSRVEIHLVRTMSWICVGTLMFTSSMLMNVVFGIITGVGTIDRMKKKANNTWDETMEEAIPLNHIFGIQSKVTWCLPTDPLFEAYDQTMGYCTAQQLMRARRYAEQQEEHQERGRQNLLSTLQTRDEVDV